MPTGTWCFRLFRLPRVDLATWDFKVWGEVEQPSTLSWDEFSALPTIEVTQDIHTLNLD